MMEKIYPSLRYHQNPSMTPRVVRNEEEDRKLEPEFDDPYGLRVKPDPIPEPKRGRPKKVTP